MNDGHNHKYYDARTFGIVFRANVTTPDKLFRPSDSFKVYYNFVRYLFQANGSGEEYE